MKQGSVLYRIERDTFEAAVQQAQGALLEAGQVCQCHRPARAYAGVGQDRYGFAGVAG